MKSDKEVIEQADEKNQTQKGGAKKGTSNAKNYTSRCTGVRLNKMFATLPEEEKGALRTTCFILLLLIDQIATMSTLVVEILNHHIGDMNSIMWQFPKKKNTYGLKKIDDALKQTKLERYHAMKPSETDMQQELVQEAMRNHIEAPAIGAAPEIKQPAVGIPVVGVPVIGSSSFATVIGAVVVRLEIVLYHLEILHSLACTSSLLLRKPRNASEKEQVAPREELEVIKDLMVDDDIEVEREVNLKAISSEYGGDLLEMEVSEQETVVVYYAGKKDVVEEVNKTMVAKNDIVLFDQEEVVGEAYQVTYHLFAGHFSFSSFILQHRSCPDKEKIVLADVFACQYIGRAFNVWTYNMSSPEGVELKMKSIWEQITSMQWDRTVSNYIYGRDLKVVNSKLILIPWNLNDDH
ncbi:hypothetical protein GIB67_012506 [Kingdonia uniflora]|uniref:Uncharacterized protein n=1 Tax=Kingdonia uniflora TaxID=39325 RepID=A0A7J7MVE1_9MAGN|nr:hypothetical protein GIB67_012506 [Kingdonia uniflora]